MHVHSWLILLLLHPFTEAGLGPVASTGHADAELSRFITQLGSHDYKERRAATQALDALGSSALDALRKASQAQDPEVRRRAESLARAIEKRVETAELLEPKHVHLVYDSTPLAEAVSDFAQKTGYSIHLGIQGAAVADRRLTLDTGDTTFWEAFELFCAKAGLVERVVQPEDVQANSDIPGRAFQGRLGGPGIVFRGPRLYSTRDEQLTLVPGKEKSYPTCHTGAVRIRALSAHGTVWGQAPPSGETFFVLEVTPQPKMAWHNIETRIDRAIDEQGQNLMPIPTNGDALRIAAMLANNALLWDPQTGQPTAAGVRQLPVHLKLADKPTRVLKEVEGVVLAQVQTPPRALLSVDNILKAAGQAVKDPADGKRMKILEVKEQTGGNVSIRLQLEDPMGLPGLIAFNRRGVMRINGAIRNGIIGPNGQTNASECTFTLIDTHDQCFALDPQARRDSITTNGNALCWEIELNYHPHDGQSEPAKLVYSGRRWVVIEVPFTLRDVPVW